MQDSKYHIVNNTSHKNYRFQGKLPFFEIIREIAEETGFKTKDVGFIIYFFFEKAATRILEDGELQVYKFGKFTLSERTVINFDGEEKPAWSIRFSPCVALKAYIKEMMANNPRRQDQDSEQ